MSKDGKETQPPSFPQRANASGASCLLWLILQRKHVMYNIVSLNIDWPWDALPTTGDHLVMNSFIFM